jgi:3-dehydroquinate synthase
MLDKQQIRLHNSEEYTITVSDYPITEISRILDVLQAKKIILAVDSNVNDKQPALIKELTNMSEDASLYRVPAGESSKSITEWKNLADFCLSRNPDRKTALIAVGGGVTGDLAGFAASTVLRGLPLIHVPTTLLAVVDSSIGGKTGINHESGKNLVGTFYQPRAVVAPLSVFETLSDREFLCGFGEILKYGAIADTDILTILSGRNLLELRGHTELLKSIIQRSIKVKADVVIRDTLESNLRMILNYGHTFAHAIEKVTGYGKISHGEAVYMGMIAAGLLSDELGASLDHSLLEQHAASMLGSEPLPSVSGDELVDAMKSDKKKTGSTLRFVVLKQYGRPYTEEISDTQLVKKVWETARQRITDIRSGTTKNLNQRTTPAT